MNIIIIGPDGAGKTTFAKKLADQFNMEYVKCSFREDNKIERARELLKGNNQVFDRFYFPDHIIYTLVKNPKMEGDEARQFEDEIESLLNILHEIEPEDILVIYFTADTEVLEKRIDERGDEYITKEDIGAIKREYKNALDAIDRRGWKIVAIRSKEDFTTEIFDLAGGEL